MTVSKLVPEMKQLRKDGLSKRANRQAPRGQSHLHDPLARPSEAPLVR